MLQNSIPDLHAEGTTVENFNGIEGQVFALDGNLVKIKIQVYESNENYLNSDVVVVYMQKISN